MTFSSVALARANRRFIAAAIAVAMVATLIVIPGSPAEAVPGVAFKSPDDLDPTPGNGSTLLNKPTSMDWGPDDRLYVGEQFGKIRIFDVTRTAGGDYKAIEASDSPITTISQIQNHNDDGSNYVSGGAAKRLMTGIHVTEEAGKVVIYATSSDPRIGGGFGCEPDCDLNLDTNSGIISKLVKSGATWTHTQLVQGLPRSEENHGPNGLWLDHSTNTLYVAVGGNTNKGAPSPEFAELPEYALSAAILSIDLDAISSPPYKLPTLQGGANPWGGDDGANMAKLVSGGPVQVYAPGFRNPYDVIITEAGRMYTIDNGGNSGWGNTPIGVNTANCTNAVNDGGSPDRDKLHLITSPGYFGGHPNPTRGNPAGSGFSGAVPSANRVECDYTDPGNGPLTFDFSTNSIAEYTASTFSGALQGDLLTVDYSQNGDTKLRHIDINPANGQLGPGGITPLATPGQAPLAVAALGDDDQYPGVIFVANWVASDTADPNTRMPSLVVFEPDEDLVCVGGYNANDDDNDGYTNADEIDNGTDPCSAGDTPPDWDNDNISDLNDPDDDNDGIPDVTDAFALDPDNGTTTAFPVDYGWENDEESPGGLLGLGFTGMMTNGSDTWLDQHDPAEMTVGGAAGVLTVDNVTSGDALGATNSQDYAFQLGVEPPANTKYSAHTRLITPFEGLAPKGFQSIGLFIGTGDQDNYVKITAAADGGNGGIQVVKEVNATPQTLPTVSQSLPGPNTIDLWLTVDPATNKVQASYAIDGGTRKAAGEAVSIPSSWLSKPIAVGIISTSAGASSFGATWDSIDAFADSWTPGTTPPPPAGGFTDIGNSVFQTEINWLADEGITKGCNPPTNSKFCPTDVVTRGQMAAFLHRALDGVLTPRTITDFTDDNNSVFEADIEWLGATGVTKGCNPPTNNKFCPDDPVTRGQMAAFLHRALDGVLTPGAITDFTDDNNSVFEADIEWLGATGVTKGCNPPTNNKFCPDDPVTREQMAAFLYRALGS